MSDEAEQKPRVRPRSLLGVLRFLLRYPKLVSLAVGLLLINICIEMSLPQILGTAITDLRLHVEGRSTSTQPPHPGPLPQGGEGGASAVREGAAVPSKGGVAGASALPKMPYQAFPIAEYVEL